MTEVRDLLKELGVINDDEYTEMDGVKSLRSGTRFGSHVYYYGDESIYGFSGTRSKDWFNGPNGKGIDTFNTIANYIKNNGKAFGKMSYRHSLYRQELEGNHVYITDTLVCVHYLGYGQWTEEDIGIYHRDTFDILNISKGTILYKNDAKRYVLRQLI